jgi:hypothetical protein
LANETQDNSSIPMNNANVISFVYGLKKILW